MKITKGNCGREGMRRMDRTTVTHLTHEEAVERAKKIARNVKARFHETEKLNCQPAETIREFKEAGLVRAMVPKRWGGHQLGFDTLMRTGIEIAKADPSAGWVYVLLVVHNWMLAYYAEEAQREVWGPNPDACLASSFNMMPGSEVVPAEGGYRVNGVWGFSSGIDHSDYIMAQGNVGPFDEDGVASEYVFMVIPRSRFTILHDTWDTSAQRGTGSKNVRIDNVFVPKHMVIDMVPWCQRGEGPGRAVNPELLYSHPLYAAMPVCLTTAVLGAAIGFYETWRDGLKSKMSLRGARVAEFTHMQIRAAEVEGMLEAAEALLEKNVRRLSTGEPIDTHERLRIRRNFAIVAKLCSQASKMIFDASGAGAVYHANPLQRYWRDIQCGSMHLTFNLDWLGEMFGKMEFGLPLGKKDALLS